MVRLTRTVRFTINPGDPEVPWGPADNSFAGYPSIRGLGRYYELDAACAGEVDPATGYFLNIKAIDQAVRAVAVPAIARAIARDDGSEAAGVLRGLIPELDRALGGRLASVRWRLTPYYSVEMIPSDASTALLRQQFDFAASHRLHSAALSERENREVFGKCNHPGGHGHNYRVEPCVEVGVGADGATRFGLADLEHLTARLVIDRFDHKHLNEDTAEFAPGRGMNPSVENIAKACYDLLAPAIAAHAGTNRLRSVTVWETDKTSATYPG